jgi:hypothetical protein
LSTRYNFVAHLQRLYIYRPHHTYVRPSPTTHCFWHFPLHYHTVYIYSSLASFTSTYVYLVGTLLWIEIVSTTSLFELVFMDWNRASHRNNPRDEWKCVARSLRSTHWLAHTDWLALPGPTLLARPAQLLQGYSCVALFYSLYPFFLVVVAQR